MIIGIVGLSGSGKTTIAKQIEARGFFRVSLDDLARELTPYLLPKIVEAFGEAIVKDGKLDREALSKLVFFDQEAKQKLDAIFADQIWDNLRDLLNENEDIIVEGYDLPIGLEPDLLLSIHAPYPVLTLRLQHREPDTSLEVIRARLAIQSRVWPGLTHMIKAFAKVDLDTFHQSPEDIEGILNKWLGE